jgi:hypothetical protein
MAWCSWRVWLSAALPSPVAILRRSGALLLAGLVRGGALLRCETGEVLGTTALDTGDGLHTDGTHAWLFIGNELVCLALP